MSTESGMVLVPRNLTHEQLVVFANATGLTIDDAFEEYAHLIELFAAAPASPPTPAPLTDAQVDRWRIRHGLCSAISIFDSRCAISDAQSIDREEL